jgi:agmatinase
MKTYAGIPENYATLSNSKIVLIPVPYEGTNRWQKGASKGPQAFLEASENMELYDIETDSEVYKEGVFLADPITENASPQAMVNEVHQTVKKFINRNKFVTVFGGEHAVSIGTVKAFNDCFQSLTVLHFDAHANLRKEFEGSPYHHKCAMYEANQNTNLVQVGIRSMDISEKRTMNPDKVFFAHDMAVNEYWMDDVIDQLTSNVFISFDFSALDASLFTATGNPVSGGLFYYETMEFLKRVFAEKNVVGFDMAEFCPNPNQKSSDALAAKLYYKMLSYKFSSKDDTYDTDDSNSNNNPFSKLSKFKNDEEEF